MWHQLREHPFDARYLCGLQKPYLQFLAFAIGLKRRFSNIHKMDNTSATSERPKLSGRARSLSDAVITPLRPNPKLLALETCGYTVTEMAADIVSRRNECYSRLQRQVTLLRKLEADREAAPAADRPRYDRDIQVVSGDIRRLNAEVERLKDDSTES